MRRSVLAAAAVSALVFAGCSSSTPSTGDVQPAAPEPVADLYSPASRAALAFGLPDLVQGIRLDSSPPDVIRAEESDFAYDLAIRRLLVENALPPDVVTIEHKGDTWQELPTVALSAVQIRDIPAQELTGFDPSFYLLLTSVTKEQWDWVGDKPGAQPAIINGRDVWATHWTESGFHVAWYTFGDVLYIVMAKNEQLLSAALRDMPRPQTAA